MTLYHRAADMLERYGRVNGVMHREVSMLIAELRAASQPVAEARRLMLPPDKIRWTVGTDSRDGKPYLMDEDFTYDALWRCGGDFESAETHAEYVREVCALLNAAPAPAQPRQPLSDAALEALWEKTFSTRNPFCPCDLRTFIKTARAVERAITGDKP